MKLLSGIILTFACSMAFAQNLGQVFLQAGQTVDVLPYQRMIVSCGENTQQPPATVPSCTLSGAGVSGSTYFMYRIAQNGNVLYGTDDISELLRKLDNFAVNRICGPAKQNCVLAGAGVVGSTYFASRVMADSAPVFGSDNIDESVKVLGSFKRANVCR